MATIRELGMVIDDIETNPAYVNSGLSVYSIAISIRSAEDSLTNAIADQIVDITVEKSAIEKDIAVLDEKIADLESRLKILDKVGVLICKKFVLHNMIVEGHTDSYAIKSSIFPSNWELSGARACSVVRYLIDRFKFSPSLFSATGYADTRPLETSISPKDPANRRVEVLILKNKYKKHFGAKNDFTLNLTKAQQDAIQKQRAEIIKTVEGDSISLAARKLLEENRKRIDVKKQKSEKLSRRNLELYVNLEDTKTDKDMPAIEKRVIKLNTDIPEDEDFGL